MAARPAVARLRLLALCLALAGCDVAPAAGRGSWKGGELAPARPKPSFILPDTEGRAFDFARETRGTVTLLFFGFTSCPDICPVHMANIAAGLRSLEPRQRQDVRVVFVTTDPRVDTPERIRAWLDNFDSTFIGLRGSEEELAAVERSVGAAASVRQSTAPGDTTYSVAHSAMVYAFTPDDSLRVLYPFGTRTRDWAEDLPRLLRVGS